jgi:hypothetical protein
LLLWATEIYLESFASVPFRTHVDGFDDKTDFDRAKLFLAKIKSEFCVLFIVESVFSFLAVVCRLQSLVSTLHTHSSNDSSSACVLQLRELFCQLQIAVMNAIERFEQKGQSTTTLSEEESEPSVLFQQLLPLVQVRRSGPFHTPATISPFGVFLQFCFSEVWTCSVTSRWFFWSGGNQCSIDHQTVSSIYSVTSSC